MDITIDKKALEAMGPEALAAYGMTEDQWKWKHGLNINLFNHTKAACRKLRDILTKHVGLPGIKLRIADIDRWLLILDGEKVRCKRLRDFDAMLKQYLKPAPKHWLYHRRGESDTFQPYYVSNIHYTPPQKQRGERVVPGYVTVTIHWEELATYHEGHITFWEEDVVDLTVGKALGAAGYEIESPALAEQYRVEKKRYGDIYNKVGMQFTATGEAEEESESKSYWWRRRSTIKLDRHGVPSRVVIDVLNEDDEVKSKERHPPSASFWSGDACDHEGHEDDDDDDIGPGDEDEDQEHTGEIVEIPLHPAVMCFDLKRHTRLKIYVEQLTDYVYQADLDTKLILPAEVTDLVSMLVQHRGGFQDIVGNKGGGAIIMCAGPPGTGKTLTSEVYSEAMSRPLYSVQCSQLGVDPKQLEQELLKTFARAQRWNAILLLDEADVYVAARGTDLTQNAIVGVFLRVLEYYGGVLFMTTNRADLVDDAVASRCLARITYSNPTPENQKRIWRTLADTAGIAIHDTEIDRIVKQHSNLSGRDVKNLLKLASMTAAAGDGRVTAKMVDFVRQFKPTTDYSNGGSV